VPWTPVPHSHKQAHVSETNVASLHELNRIKTVVYVEHHKPLGLINQNTNAFLNLLKHLLFKTW